MDIGMLWYDDTKRDLDAKVAQAVEHYKTKYGATPTVCFVNPALLAAKDAPDTAAGLALRPARTVLPNHFWIGVGEAGAAQSNGKNGKRRN
jgi:hypothetical protein